MREKICGAENNCGHEPVYAERPKKDYVWVGSRQGNEIAGARQNSIQKSEGAPQIRGESCYFVHPAERGKFFIFLIADGAHEPGGACHGGNKKELTGEKT